jgi:archaellin
MRIGWIGGFECLIILIILVIVAALAFRIGATRNRRQ